MTRMTQDTMHELLTAKAQSVDAQSALDWVLVEDEHLADWVLEEPTVNERAKPATQEQAKPELKYRNAGDD